MYEGSSKASPTNGGFQFDFKLGKCEQQQTIENFESYESSNLNLTEYEDDDFKELPDSIGSTFSLKRVQIHLNEQGNVLRKFVIDIII